MKKFYLILSSILVVIFAGFLFSIPKVQADTMDKLYGWAWSGALGWISFNNYDLSGTNPVQYTAIPFGVTYNDNGDGTANLSGFAWSEIAGWIEFGGNTGSPDGNNISKIDLTTGEMSGWAKSLSLGNDGWISLKGIATDSSPYSTKFLLASGEATPDSWAWGNMTDWIALNSTSPLTGPNALVKIVTLNQEPTVSFIAQEMINGTPVVPGGSFLSMGSKDNGVVLNWTGTNIQPNSCSIQSNNSNFLPFPSSNLSIPGQYLFPSGTFSNITSSETLNFTIHCSKLITLLNASDPAPQITTVQISYTPPPICLNATSSANSSSNSCCDTNGTCSLTPVCLDPTGVCLPNTSENFDVTWDTASYSNCSLAVVTDPNNTTIIPSISNALSTFTSTGDLALQGLNTTTQFTLSCPNPNGGNPIVVKKAICIANTPLPSGVSCKKFIKVKEN